MAQNSKLEIDLYIDLALRRKWWIIIPFFLSILGGVGALKVLPKTYRASTLILLEPQAIPESFVKSTIVDTVESQLQTIQQQIHSRTNLERIIDEYQLEKHNVDTPMKKIKAAVFRRLPFLAPPEPSSGEPRLKERMEKMELVEKLQDSITVNLGKQTKTATRSGQQNLAFEVTFEWSDPEVMAPVVNTIIARFIEESMSMREEKAIGTTDFFEKETAALRGDIEARERELEAFKKENMGMLPDQLQSNLSILNQLTEERLSIERRLDQDKQQLMFLKSQQAIAQAERSARQSAALPDQRPGGARQTAGLTNEQLTSGDLADLEGELARMGSHYTEQHPDILALKRRIEELKREGPKARSASAVAAPGKGAADFTIDMQLSQINARIASTEKEIEETDRQIQHYKERVERTPQVEMALNKILRDYTTARQRYDDLLSKKMDAKMAEQMERRRKGEQFRVLDPAVKPLEPFKPEKKKIALGALAVGLGLGFGCAYLREMIDPCFYDPGDLETFAEANILVSLPDMSVKVKG